MRARLLQWTARLPRGWAPDLREDVLRNTYLIGICTGILTYVPEAFDNSRRQNPPKRNHRRRKSNEQTGRAPDDDGLRLDVKNRKPTFGQSAPKALHSRKCRE